MSHVVPCADVSVISKRIVLEAPYADILCMKSLCISMLGYSFQKVSFTIGPVPKDYELVVYETLGSMHGLKSSATVVDKTVRLIF